MEPGFASKTLNTNEFVLNGGDILKNRAPKRYGVKHFKPDGGSIARSGTRYWTHYWNRDTWLHNAEGESGKTLEHTAGNQFRQRGVSVGHFLYLVTVQKDLPTLPKDSVTTSKRQLFLAGRMQVGQIVNQRRRKDVS